MTPPPFTDDDLEIALRDLGAHLDLGGRATSTGRAEMVSAVMARIEQLGDDATAASTSRQQRSVSRRGRHPRLAIIAAAIVVVVTTMLAITPTREAVARWFGVGAVRITRPDPTTTTTTTSTAAVTATTASAALTPPAASVTSATSHDVSDSSTQSLPSSPNVDLDALFQSLSFTVRLPARSLAGAPIAATIDPAVRSGLIEIRYDTFTLVEVGSAPGQPPALEKVLGPGTTTEPVTVDGRSGLWISGDPHQIAFLDPSGNFTIDPVRRAGNVLLWEDNGVTYRIEGLPSIELALTIAASLD